MTPCPALRPTVRERYIELTAEGQLYTAQAKLAEVENMLTDVTNRMEQYPSEAYDRSSLWSVCVDALKIIRRKEGGE